MNQRLFPHLYHLVFVGAVFLALTSAVPARAGQDETFGTLIGAGFGGLIGNQFGHGNGRTATTIGGVLAGGLIGNSMGHAADEAHADALRYAEMPSPVSPRAIYYAEPYLPNYVAPDDPPQAIQDENPSDYCREYSQLVSIGGQMKETYGTACLQPDGNWKAVN